MYAIYELAADDFWYKRAVSAVASPVPGTISLKVSQVDFAPAVLEPFLLGALYGQSKILEFQSGSQP